LKATTEGEKLFIIVRNELLPHIGKNVFYASLASFADALGNQKFAQFLNGAIALQLTKRLAMYWSHKKIEIPNPDTHIRTISEFIKSEISPLTDAALSSKIARAVAASDRASDKDISPSVRKAIVGSRSIFTCYLCGNTLDTSCTLEDDPKFFSLDHLWPTSLGGDSIEDNLLPACRYCQKEKANSASWEFHSVHNFLLSPEPSSDSINSIGKETKLARHFLAALECAEENNLNLKSAFQQIGSLRKPISYFGTGSPITFFDLETKEND
jgi:hypothetical protein